MSYGVMGIFWARGHYNFCPHINLSIQMIFITDTLANDTHNRWILLLT